MNSIGIHLEARFDDHIIGKHQVYVTHPDSSFSEMMAISYVESL